MTPFTPLEAAVLPLDRAHVDTDQIIPKQFLKTTERAGLGRGLFFAWRQDPALVLNQPRYGGAHILVAGENFGCGSSREHAVWALMDYGIRCVIAPSFGDIFYNNCCKNGLLPVRLALPDAQRALAAGRLRVDLATQTVIGAGPAIHFEIAPAVKQRLLEGLDEIALTLRRLPQIEAYEAMHP